MAVDYDSIPGADPIWLDGVICEGTEATLAECPANEIGINDCSHGEDVAVRCEASCVASDDCAAGDVCLGSLCVPDTCSADFECAESLDGTACADGICGCATSEDCLGNASCDDGLCVTGECATAADCLETEYCDERYCAPIPAVTTRLRDGETQLDGRLEVFANREWGTVCDDGWFDAQGLANADVACRELGFGPAGGFTRVFGGGAGEIWLDGLACVGDEARVFDCPANPIGDNDCNHDEDVAVTCLPLGGCRDDSDCDAGTCDLSTQLCEVPEEGDIRLEDGATPNTGRLEYYHNGEWGTVCHDFWDAVAAQVACRQLGFGPPIVADFDAVGGEGRIWIDLIICNGTESALSECAPSFLGDEICDHSEDVGITCAPAP